MQPLVELQSRFATPGRVARGAPTVSVDQIAVQPDGQVGVRGRAGKQLRLGGAVIELTVSCHPCSKMETRLGPGGYTAMGGHGGICARVIASGPLILGDAVLPV